MKNYEQERKNLIKKISILPKWRQDLYFAKLKEFNLVTLDEIELRKELLALEELKKNKDSKKLYLVK